MAPAGHGTCVDNIKESIPSTPAAACLFCRKLIKLDRHRHVVTFHSELAQLWHCPVSWCTVWKRTLQDCMDHLRKAHAVPKEVNTSNMGQWFPPWTVRREVWTEALKPSNSGISTDVLLFSGLNIGLVHHYRVFRKGAAHVSLRRDYLQQVQAFVSQAAALDQCGRPEDVDPSSASPACPKVNRLRDSDEESPAKCVVWLTRYTQLGWRTFRLTCCFPWPFLIGIRTPSCMTVDCLSLCFDSSEGPQSPLYRWVAYVVEPGCTSGEGGVGGGTDLSASGIQCGLADVAVPRSGAGDTGCVFPGLRATSVSGTAPFGELSAYDRLFLDIF